MAVESCQLSPTIAAILLRRDPVVCAAGTAGDNGEGHATSVSVDYHSSDYVHKEKITKKELLSKIEALFRAASCCRHHLTTYSCSKSIQLFEM